MGKTSDTKGVLFLEQACSHRKKCSLEIRSQQCFPVLSLLRLSISHEHVLLLSTNKQVFFSSLLCLCVCKNKNKKLSPRELDYIHTASKRFGLSVSLRSRGLGRGRGFLR